MDGYKDDDIVGINEYVGAINKNWNVPPVSETYHSATYWVVDVDNINSAVCVSRCTIKAYIARYTIKFNLF